jgi:ABC-type transport system involved in multi-copper enzyme maturation permease subunit
MKLLDSPLLDQTRPAGTIPLRLISAEIMKIRTTNTWWLFLAGITIFTAQGLISNSVSHHYQLYPPLNTMDAAGKAQALAQAASARTHTGLAAIAADMMNSAHFVGVLFAMLIGILLMTNEFAHHTVTATFMTNPHRTVVIMAKLVAAACFGALFWLLSTIINTVVTPIYLHSQHISVSLTDWTVVRPVLLNLLAFVMWAVVGLGLGTLVRSQIGSVVTGMTIYLVGFAAVELIFHLTYNFYRHAWVLGAPVIAPAVASFVMITPGRAFPHAPPQWVGLVVMVGYVLAFSAIGIALTRRRDLT